MPSLINDRTSALRAALKEQDSYGASDAVTISLDEKGNPMADFFRQVEEVTHFLDRIESSVEEIKPKYNATFCTVQTDEKLNEEIEGLTAEIRRLASKVRSKIKSMEEDVEAESIKNDSPAIYRMKQTQHLALSRRFVDIMFMHSKIQDDHREKCTERIKRQFEIMDKPVTDDELQEMVESGNLTVFIDVTETQRAKEALADVEARHAEIIKLEKSIKELQQMFIDVSLLVESQGEVINNIECYVANTAEYAENARRELEKARDQQVKLKKKKIIIAIVVIVVLVIVGVIIWASAK